MKRHGKTALAALIMAATVLAFAYYCHKHPHILSQLRHMPPVTLAALVGLYAAWFVALVFITRASLLLYNKRLGLAENFLFNAYSSLINFFGPGQSGPIFRGAYLKKRHGLGVKQYVFTLLVYYAWYAVVSICMIGSGTLPWWQTAAAAMVVIAVSIGVLRWYTRRNHVTGSTAPLWHVPHMALLGVMTLLQLVIQAVIFGIELHNVHGGATAGQVLTYTGIANLALFVSLTPGAIGIREAFLAFSQNLHHIPGTTIVAANIVDRAVFLVFLGLLFVLVMSLHARDKLQVRQLTTEPSDKT